MKKRIIIGASTIGVMLLGLAGASPNSQQNTAINKPQSSISTHAPEVKSDSTAKAVPICDGTSITTNCTSDGVAYKSYVYHAAVPEKSHTETVTTYQKKIVGYCTLCNDGTYSPSCATGRGACSWHDGVQEWNAPQYSNVAVNSTRTVIDAAAQEAYYDKVPQ